MEKGFSYFYLLLSSESAYHVQKHLIIIYGASVTAAIAAAAAPVRHGSQVLCHQRRKVGRALR